MTYIGGGGGGGGGGGAEAPPRNTKILSLVTELD